MNLKCVMGEYELSTLLFLLSFNANGELVVTIDGISKVFAPIK